MVVLDLESLDSQSLDQLRTMLEQQGQNLTPAWQAVRRDLSSRSLGTLPTPTATPHRIEHSMSSSAFDLTVDVPPRPAFHSIPPNPRRIFDEFVESFFAAAAESDNEDNETDANFIIKQRAQESLESFFAAATESDTEPTTLSRKRKRKHLQDLTDSDEEARQTRSSTPQPQPVRDGESGGDAGGGAGTGADGEHQPQMQRLRGDDECNRGGHVPPPGMIHHDHAQQRVEQAQTLHRAEQIQGNGQSNQANASTGPTSGAGASASSSSSFASPSQASPFANYSSPYFAPLAKTLIAAMTRICGKASRLLYDQSYMEAWDRDIHQLLGGDPKSSEPPGDSVGLLRLGKCCLDAHRDEAQAKFVGVLACLSLTAKVQALMESDNAASLQRVWELYVAPQTPEYNFNKWHEWFGKGKRWALFGQAGGIYFILLAIFAGETSALEKAYVCDSTNMCYHLRAPYPGLSMTRLLASTLAPAIKLLQATHPIDTNGLFDKQTLDAMEISSSVQLEDWVSSDLFFRTFKSNYFHIPDRDMMFWAPGMAVGGQYTSISLGTLAFQEDDLGTQPTEDEPEEERDGRQDDATTANASDHYWTDVLDALAKVKGTQHTKIKTKFQVKHPQNMFKLRGASRKKSLEVTKAERALAAEARVPDDYKEFCKLLRKQVAHGYRVDPSLFVYLDRHLIFAEHPDKFLHILDDVNKPFVVLLPPAPKQYADIIIPVVQEIFPTILKTRDSNDGHRFYVLHHTFYNRSATRGTEAPEDGDAWKLGKKGKKRIDPSQNAPRLSAEGHDERWPILKDALQGLTDWLTQQLFILLKEQYTVLDAFITALPGSSAPSVYPFGGMVINFNVSTLSHRDHGDKRICLVLSAQEGEGGELVLLEPGIVVRLRTGDSVVFRSCDITHFNMPYKGIRVSLVFHSDHDGDTWVDNRNGWKTKAYFSG